MKSIAEICSLIKQHGTLHAWYSKQADRDHGTAEYIGLDGATVAITITSEEKFLNYGYKDAIYLGLVINHCIKPKRERENFWRMLSEITR